MRDCPDSVETGGTPVLTGRVISPGHPGNVAVGGWRDASPTNPSVLVILMGQDEGPDGEVAGVEHQQGNRAGARSRGYWPIGQSPAGSGQRPSSWSSPFPARSLARDASRGVPRGRSAHRRCRRRPRRAIAAPAVAAAAARRHGRAAPGRRPAASVEPAGSACGGCVAA